MSCFAYFMHYSTIYDTILNYKFSQNVYMKLTLTLTFFAICGIYNMYEGAVF